MLNGGRQGLEENHRRLGFRKTIGVKEALEKLLKEVKPLSAEDVSIFNAYGRILASDVYAPQDLPPFDRAAMDGYAVKAQDTFNASALSPVILKVIGEVDAGSTFEGSLKSGEAIQVGTGALMPNGADAVVMFEYTKPVEEGLIEVYRHVIPGENVSKKGEDVKARTKVLPKGLILRSYDVALLAGLGLNKVKVLRKPEVAVATIGLELVEPGCEVKPGKIFDVNRYFLISAVKALGCQPLDLGITPDNPEEIKLKISMGVEKADLMVLAGGTSVGAKDETLESLKKLDGFRLLFHGVALRPGKPVAAAAVNGKIVILLPGYPVSAMICFRLFVAPLIGKMSGLRLPEALEVKIKGKLSRRVPSPLGVLDVVRVKVLKSNGENLIEPVRITGSGVISSMVKADGLLFIPENREGFEVGEEVEVILLRGGLIFDV
jgi:molybdenum cofactor synthesis domain-containing protein